jgi:hypothetical protein
MLEPYTKTFQRLSKIPYVDLCFNSNNPGSPLQRERGNLSSNISWIKQDFELYDDTMMKASRSMWELWYGFTFITGREMCDLEQT